jgi:hypothetical protein
MDYRWDIYGDNSLTQGESLIPRPIYQIWWSYFFCCLAASSSWQDAPPAQTFQSFQVLVFGIEMGWLPLAQPPHQPVGPPCHAPSHYMYQPATSHVSSLHVTLEEALPAKRSRELGISQTLVGLPRSSRRHCFKCCSATLGSSNMACWKPIRWFSHGIFGEPRFFYRRVSRRMIPTNGEPKGDQRTDHIRIK